MNLSLALLLPPPRFGSDKGSSQQWQRGAGLSVTRTVRLRFQSVIAVRMAPYSSAKAPIRLHRAQRCNSHGAPQGSFPCSGTKKRLGKGQNRVGLCVSALSCGQLLITDSRITADALCFAQSLLLPTSVNGVASCASYAGAAARGVLLRAVPTTRLLQQDGQGSGSFLRR